MSELILKITLKEKWLKPHFTDEETGIQMYPSNCPFQGCVVSQSWALNPGVSRDTEPAAPSLASKFTWENFFLIHLIDIWWMPVMYSVFYHMKEDSEKNVNDMGCVPGEVRVVNSSVFNN